MGNKPSGVTSTRGGGIIPGVGDEAAPAVTSRWRVVRAARAHRDGTDTRDDALRLLCWNIGNPSLERARRQGAWLPLQRPDVIVLTECRDGPATAHLTTELARCGFDVFLPDAPGAERGVVLATRRAVTETAVCASVDYLPSRIVSVRASWRDMPLEIVGVYVPSRGFDTERLALRKRTFVDALRDALERCSSEPSRLVCGDLNVLEPGHVPHHPHLQAWEYEFYDALRGMELVDAFRHLHPDVVDHSWYGRSGHGYRYDHCFVSPSLVEHVERCEYVHAPRYLKLSDHSAMVLELVDRRRNDMHGAR